MTLVRTNRSCTILSTVPLVLVGIEASARAVEVNDVAGYPLTVDVTNTAVLNYHFNNRNEHPYVVAGYLDDNYGEWLDRLNLQMDWFKFRLGLRIDGATYVHAPTMVDAQRIVDDQRVVNGMPQGQRAQNLFLNAFAADLHTRYRSTYFPSKLSIGYGTRGLDVTVGDFYVQLGRGLVFSVRKIDELAIDTTVRGIKAVWSGSVGKGRVGATLFAGQMNPLRIDEASGRRLNGAGSPLFFGFPTATNFTTSTYDDSGHAGTVVWPATASYREDTALGGHIEAGTDAVLLGVNAAGLLRSGGSSEGSADESRQHNRIFNVSGTLTVPSILGHGDLYLEVARQHMGDGSVATGISGASYTAPDRDGYAVYASATAKGGPLSVSLEGKHYRSYFPLAANILTSLPAFGAPEFNMIAYSQPPTAEPIYVEPVGGGAPQICVTGGRGRADYRFNRDTAVYGWLGRYTSWSETPASNPGCSTARVLQTETWDSAAGVELRLDGGASLVRAWAGGRTSDLAAPSGAIDNTTTFYREGYLRYDLVKHLAGPFSVQLQGFHRKRFEPISRTNAWFEGENYTSLQWSPHLAAVFGYEYLAKEGCQPAAGATVSQPNRPARDVCHFINGGLSWRSRASGAASVLESVFDTVSIFVGQRRGAVRCVSGVCRLLPPFEGGKIEITSRF